MRKLNFCYVFPNEKTDKLEKPNEPEMSTDSSKLLEFTKSNLKIKYNVDSKL